MKIKKPYGKAPWEAIQNVSLDGLGLEIDEDLEEDENAVEVHSYNK